ncbi:DNA repair protein RadC [Cryomorphaceae bacterium]|nr:DNA repair protein RadC [Cryomorphaceae bacterium]
MDQRPEKKQNSWLPEERPREKFLNWGRAYLSNAELIALLLGSGTSSENALELAKRILALTQENLYDLGRLDQDRLITVRGMGLVKSIRLLAAIELGRRREGEQAQIKSTIHCSKEAYEMLKPQLADLNHEEFWVVYLNNANKVLKKTSISKGGISGTVVDLRVLFKEAFAHGATSLIMAHNHPSGNKVPSTADLQLTSRVKEAGKLMDIKVLDHLIITEREYYSFADEQQL